MTDPKTAAAYMAVATATMSPEEVRAHCIALAELVAMFDEGVAAMHTTFGLPYVGVEALLPDVYGFETMIAGGADD